MGQKHRLKVNQSHDFEFSEDAIQQLEILKEKDAALTLLKDKKKYEVEFSYVELGNKNLTVQVNGTPYVVEISNPLDLLIEKMGFELATAGKVGSIEAPMPGLILEVAVAEGQEVKEGETLLILEAMKMENVLTSPVDGVIKSVSVEKGQAVEKKQLLLNFE